MSRCPCERIRNRHFPKIEHAPNTDYQRRARQTSGGHLGYHNGYVVTTSLGDGSLDQRVNCLNQVFIARQGRFDLFVGQLVEETVTANNDPVPFFDGERCPVNVDIGPDTEGPSENPVVGMLSCLPSLSVLRAL